MCDGTVVTPEGLIVCRDTGEVLGVEMEHEPRSVWGESSHAMTLDRATHYFVQLKRPKGGILGKQAPDAGRVRQRLEARDVKIVHVLSVLHEMAERLGAPRSVVEDVATALRKLLDSNSAKGLGLDDVECEVATALTVALSNRGMFVPDWLREYCERGETLSRAMKYSQLIPRVTVMPARRTVEATAESLSAEIGLKGVTLAKKLATEAWDLKLKLGFNKGAPSAYARVAVYIVAKLTGAARDGDLKHLKSRLKVNGSVYRWVNKHLAVKVRA